MGVTCPRVILAAQGLRGKAEERPTVDVALTTGSGELTRLQSRGLDCLFLEEEGLRYLRKNTLVPQKTEYCPECGPGLDWACCFEWLQSDSQVSCSSADPSQHLTLKVTLQMDRTLEPGLIEYLRTLPLSASQRQLLIHVLQVDYGMWKLSQFASVYPELTVAKLQLQDKAKEHVVTSMLKGAVEKAKVMPTSSQDPQGVVPNSGEALGIRDLIAMEGLFRGVALQRKHATTDLQEVVTFQTEYAAMTNDALSQVVVMQPNTPIKEVVLASTSEQESAEMGDMMSSMGESGVSSMAQSSAMSASANYDGASGGASHSSAASSGGSSSEVSSNSFSSSTSDSSKAYYMSRYFIEPQAVVDVAPTMLTATQGFMDALQLLTTPLSGFSVSDLFESFGSHVCLSAELGGWWKVSASAVSEESRSTVEMSTITSSAISATVGESKSSSATAAYKTPPSSNATNETSGTNATNATTAPAPTPSPKAASAGMSRGHSSSSGSKSSSHDGTEAADDMAQSQTNVQVKQEWKGGASQVPMDNWLESLASDHSSNWKVIDRRMPMCVGIWQWAVDPVVREDICQYYVTQYLLNSGITGLAEEVEGKCECIPCGSVHPKSMSGSVCQVENAQCGPTSGTPTSGCYSSTVGGWECDCSTRRKLAVTYTSTTVTATTLVDFIKTELGAPGGYSQCQATGCIYDSAFCVDTVLSGQCGILEVEVPEKCGQWELCAGVICSASLNGYCVARHAMIRGANSDWYSYQKKVVLSAGPPAGVTFQQTEVSQPGGGSPCQSTGCIYDPQFCVDFVYPSQCGIAIDQIEQKCGQWDLCAGVICQPEWKGYCLARDQMSSAAISGWWSYQKQVDGEVLDDCDDGATCIPFNLPARCTGDEYCPQLADCYNECYDSGNGKFDSACSQAYTDFDGCCPSATSSIYNNASFGYFVCDTTDNKCMDRCNELHQATVVSIAACGSPGNNGGSQVGATVSATSTCDCAEQCTNYDGCLAWTLVTGTLWMSPGSDGKELNCYFRSEFGSVVNNCAGGGGNCWSGRAGKSDWAATEINHDWKCDGKVITYGQIQNALISAQGSRPAIELAADCESMILKQVSCSTSGTCGVTKQGIQMCGSSAARYCDNSFACGTTSGGIGQGDNKEFDYNEAFCNALAAGTQITFTRTSTKTRTTSTVTTRTTTTTPLYDRVLARICEGAADLSSLQSRIQEVATKRNQDKEEAMYEECSATTGYHWVGSMSSGSCQLNQCTCGSEPGTVGTACPVNGGEVCSNAQRAMCSSSACLSGYYFYSGTTTSTCQSSSCSASETDNNLCCTPITQSNNFIVQFQIGSNGGSCSSLQITISGAGKGQSISYNQKFTFTKDTNQAVSVVVGTVPGFTPTTIKILTEGCTLSINNGGTPSGITLYNGLISATAGSSNEVGCTFNTWQEFKGNLQTQSSSISPCSAR